MSECARAGKWFGGCRFEGRYDEVKSESVLGSFGPFASGSYKLEGDAKTVKDALAERTPKKTYVRDVCVTCGKTIERLSPTPQNGGEER